jgi:predicted XRE-type DNA-binding protein
MFTKFTRSSVLKLTSLALIVTLVTGLFLNVGAANAQGNPGRGGRGGVAVMGAVLQATVKETGLSRMEIMQQWAQGKTLTQVITDAGKSVDAVKTAAKTQLTEAINKAVTNGRITQQEANTRLAEIDAAIDTVLTTTMAEAGRKVGQRLTEVGIVAAVFQATREATGLTPDLLLEQLQAEGATFASVITANGATVEAVKTAAKTTITERVAQMVSNGRLSQTQADELLNNLDTSLDTAINGGLPEGFTNRRGGRGGNNNRVTMLLDARTSAVLIRETATLTGLTQRDILQEVRNGKTLAQIATEKNVEASAIVTAAVADITTQVNQWVTSGRLTQAQADEYLAGLEAKLTEQMNSATLLRGGRRNR